MNLSTAGRTALSASIYFTRIDVVARLAAAEERVDRPSLETRTSWMCSWLFVRRPLVGRGHGRRVVIRVVSAGSSAAETANDVAVAAMNCRVAFAVV